MAKIKIRCHEFEKIYTTVIESTVREYNKYVLTEIRLMGIHQFVKEFQLNNTQLKRVKNAMSEIVIRTKRNIRIHKRAQDVIDEIDSICCYRTIES